MSDDYITVKDKDTSENIQWIEKKEKPKKWITKKVRTHHFNKGGIKKANMGDYIVAKAVERLNPTDLERQYNSGGEIVVGKNVDKDLL